MPEQNKPLSVYVIAGEASGDMLGAGIMRALTELTRGNLFFSGIGGERMKEAGLKESLFPYHDLSLLGFAEVLPHALTITARINGTVEDILVKQPDVVISIDVPGFSRRVARKLIDSGEAEHIKRIHYVAPTVWVYNPERAKLFSELFHRLLVLLPFEPPYFLSEGLDCRFVGHPVASPDGPPGNAAAFRERHQIPPHVPLIGLLPGSRKGELRHHIPIFASGVMMMAGQFPIPPGLVVPTPSFLREEVTMAFADCPLPTFIIGEDEKRDGLAACNLAVVKSGTIALEVAMAGVPMVVAYRTSPLSAYFFRRLRRIKLVNLLNILRQREFIPELLQELCKPPFIADALAALAIDPQRRERQVREAQAALAQLRPEDGSHPSMNAAHAVLEMVRPQLLDNPSTGESP